MDLNIILKTHNSFIIKQFLESNLGIINTENNQKSPTIYIIDETYNFDYLSLKYPYFLLLNTDTKNYEITHYFQDIFIKPLDMNLIGKKINLYKKKLFNNKNFSYYDQLKIFLINNISFHSNSIQTYYQLHIENNSLLQNNLLFIQYHKYSLDIIKNILILTNNNHQLLNDFINHINHLWELLNFKIKIYHYNNCNSLILFYFIIYNFINHYKILEEFNQDSFYIQWINNDDNDFTLMTNIPLEKFLNFPFITVRFENFEYNIIIAKD